MFNKLDGIKVRDRGDCPALFINRDYVENLYAGLCAGDGEALLCEGVSLNELEHVYIGDELAMPYDQFMTAHRSGEAMFEAVSATKAQLIRTMRAFTRKLNSQLAGSGITAGLGDASTPEDDVDAPTAGGAEISPVRRVAGVPIVFARIPLSDGQSITIAFHSPTAQTAQLTGSDLLVAFRFLLNKRDVTHTVAPQGGVDVSLVQATMTLAKLAERNSAKFAKTQASARQLTDSINTKIAQLEQMNQEQNTLVEQGDSLAGELAKLDGNLSTTQKKLARQRDINEKLRAELAQLQAAVIPEPEPVPEPKPEPTPPPAGGTHPGITRPVENDPPQSTTDYASLFWYGCFQRPYGPGAVPDGVKVALSSQDARQAPIVARKEADPSRYTYGVVGYEQPLSQQDVEHFSLFDFQNHLTIDEAKEQLQPLILLMRQFKGANPDAQAMDFINTYMKLNAPSLDALPEQYREGNRANAVLITRLIQRYLGQTTSGLNTLLDMMYLGINGIEPEPQPEPAPAITFPAPENITDTSALMPLYQALTGTSSLLNDSINDYGKTTIAKATENMAFKVESRITAFREAGVSEDMLTSLQTFLQLPQGRLKAPIIADLQKRQEVVDAIIPGYAARLEEFKAALRADKPAREAEQRMIELAKNGIEELIEMSFDDEAEILSAQEQLKGWAKVLRERDIDREDEIEMAQYTLDRTLKEFRGEITPEDTLGAIVDRLKSSGVKVSDADENMLSTNPSLVNDLNDEINNARTAWQNGKARYNTEKEAIAAWATAKLHGESRPNEITAPAEQFMEFMRREGVGLNPWVADMILKYPEALRWAELSHENAMNDLDSFDGDVKAALEAYIDGGVEANFKEPDTRTPAQIQEQEHLATLQGLVSAESTDLQEIRQWRSFIRDAHTFFAANDTLETHEPLVNQAIDHIGDLMAKIARGVQ